MDDHEWEKGMHALAAELASKPNRAYRTWTLRIDGGKPTFELSEFDGMFDEILDEVYGEADKIGDWK
ncbi:hypothetical protein HNQ36_000951 [Afipia massiliensis]|uniref:Uncharacterized protein n=1 Tax=Afipia massiliensis TaxID=211460 RepID=A0A840MXS7_9BRAD|nr:hypothetical protein [Afipia massiliensis]MBB5050997.1 hypothetical protein [Afipia massiliensis]